MKIIRRYKNKIYTYIYPDNPKNFKRYRVSKEFKKGALIDIQLVFQAIRSGKLKSLKNEFTLCVDCNKNRAVHYEHRDYNKPLEVDPVCQSCNLKRGPALARLNKPIKMNCLNCEIIVPYRRGLLCKKCLSHKNYLKRKLVGYYLKPIGIKTVN